MLGSQVDSITQPIWIEVSTWHSVAERFRLRQCLEISGIVHLIDTCNWKVMQKKLYTSCPACHFFTFSWKVCHGAVVAFDSLHYVERMWSGFKQTNSVGNQVR